MNQVGRNLTDAGLDKALIFPDPGHAVAEGNVPRRERLGGVLNYFYREAA